MSFDKMTLQQRVQAANIDCMRHPKFALLSGVICMGKSEARDGVSTAQTNGRDKFYGAKFIEPLNRKQLRYLVLHENFHVGLKHCILYKDVVRKYPRLTNIAQDFVVNALIEEMDPDFTFVERPVETLCIDRKYFGWSFPQVFNDLFKQAKQQQQDGKGKRGKGQGGNTAADMDLSEDADPSDDMFNDPLDEHQHSDAEHGVDGAGKEDEEKLSRQIDDANRQGEMLSRRLSGRGNSSGGRDIFGLAQDRSTNWIDPLQDFIQTVCAGDENSRFCPPNKRLLASGFVMPSHFSETVGELLIACDTSGSMHGYYPVVFGEIARICQQVKPESVRLLWWDTSVCGDQQFKPDEYENLGKLLHPKGGGGTTVSCVAQYIAAKEYKPKAVIMLSDGYIESNYVLPELPILSGVVENDDFVPLRGKALRIRV